VYHGNNLGTAPTSLPGPGVSSGLPQGTLVSSLHASATNNIFAGTLTNGIWRYDGTNWQQTLSQVTVLSVPDPVTIANEGVTWRSFVLETAQLYTLIINNPSGILDGLGVSIAQVGFPLTVLPGQANALGIEYQLGPAPIIMALSNHTGHPITIELSQDTINHTFTITT
jgi:hypothetical protein